MSDKKWNLDFRTDEGSPEGCPFCACETEVKGDGTTACDYCGYPEVVPCGICHDDNPNMCDWSKAGCTPFPNRKPPGNGMKYLIIKEAGNTEAVLFSPAADHKDMAKKLTNGMSPMEQQIAGAGMCRMTVNEVTGQLKVTVYGESVSLGIESKEEDVNAITFAVNY